MPHKFFYMELIVIKGVPLIYTYTALHDLAVITQLIDKATTMRSYLFLIAQSLVQARERAVTIVIHYCVVRFPGSSTNWLVPNLEHSKPRAECTEKFVHGNTVSKWHPTISHAPNTFLTPS